jgi:hypothetical protein
VVLVDTVEDTDLSLLSLCCLSVVSLLSLCSLSVVYLFSLCCLSVVPLFSLCSPSVLSQAQPALGRNATGGAHQPTMPCRAARGTC